MTAKEKAERHHGNKWMPIMYVTYYGLLKDLAKEYGYALCVHGSITRDFDLVAVPWEDNPKSHEEFLTAIRKLIGQERNDDTFYDSVGYEPNGRTCYTIQCGAGGYFDISFTPTLKQAIDMIEKQKQNNKEIKLILEQS